MGFGDDEWSVFRSTVHAPLLGLIPVLDVRCVVLISRVDKKDVFPRKCAVACPHGPLSPATSRSYSRIPHGT